MCCLRGRQAQSMCTDHAGPAACCKHSAGSSVCSRAPRNVSAPRAASCPDNIRLTFSCHSSIPDTLNILFTSESLFHTHAKLSISSATRNFYAIFFLLEENILSVTWYVYKAGCAAKERHVHLQHQTMWVLKVFHRKEEKWVSFSKHQLQSLDLATYCHCLIYYKCYFSRYCYN